LSTECRNFIKIVVVVVVVLDNFKIQPLFLTRSYFEGLFIRKVYKCVIICPSLSEAVVIRVTVRKIRDFIRVYLFCFQVINVLFATP
jgi:hypothetical protein